MNIILEISNDLNISTKQIESTIKLREEGGTVPFIARYRKEWTGNLDENQIRDIFDKQDYYKELEDRKKTILDSIESQGKLTDELKEKILNCKVKTELEDIYLPYKPKRRTRATIARERGLEPLSDIIMNANVEDLEIDFLSEAEKFVDEEKEVSSAEDALKGAADILAEHIAEDAEIRKWCREFIKNTGSFTAKVKDEFEEGSTKYEMYRDFNVKVSDVTPHIMLALRRGETEGIVDLGVDYDEDEILAFMLRKNLYSFKENITDFYSKVVKDAFSRLIKHSIIGEIRLDKKQFADEMSIDVFEKNLKEMLLSSPAGMKPTLGIDPGIRTGCKVAVIDSTTKFVENITIYPFESERKKAQATNDLRNLITKHKIELIAIGNGTAGRETETFVKKVIENMEPKPIAVMVNESGASIYSASKVANEEFPELDLTVRGAISIGRRLQDPLSELVKIDPKSVGVGQYQHDVDQKLLKKKLEETVESCVNFVGVDLNLASKELLNYVAGLNGSIAKRIIEWRNKNGAFKTREELKKVTGLGAKTFEQSAGFLRITNGENPLDNTAVHPESYEIVQQMINENQIEIKELSKSIDKIRNIQIKNYITETIGEPTLIDIISELEKPGRDPREQFTYAQFKEGINSISDLKEGLELEGVVTNVTNFGAFVDIGVHQDGLVHISELANQFVKDPTKVVKVGQVVKVMVLDINEKLSRIQLSMKRLQKAPVRKKEKSFSVSDLQKKFNKL